MCEEVRAPCAAMMTRRPFAHRLAKTTNSPFVRTEATRFTEVGIVGGTAEDMIKELQRTGASQLQGDT